MPIYPDQSEQSEGSLCLGASVVKLSRDHLDLVHLHIFFTRNSDILAFQPQQIALFLAVGSRDDLRKGH